MPRKIPFSIVARPFDFPFDGEVDRQSVALLIIDIQTDFLASDGYFARKGYDPAPLRAVIPTITSILTAARESGFLVIWTRQGYRADLADLSEYERWRCKRSGILFDDLENDSVLIRSGPGYDIVPELTPLPNEPIVEKTANNAFYQTDLDLILKAKGIRHILFAGCTTDVCVHSTLREANDRKYQCLLIEDACASGDVDMHRAAVKMVMVEDGIFGAVANAEAVVRGFEAFSAPTEPAQPI